MAFFWCPATRKECRRACIGSVCLEVSERKLVTRLRARQMQLARCEHLEINLDLGTGERRCTSCGELLPYGAETPPPPPRGSLRTLFEVRGRSWFMVGVGLLLGVAAYLLIRVLP